MSNTIITNYSNVSGNTAESDKSLVIIVNKDGSVSLEKDTIKSLLDKEYENTNVSIVRMNEDGKPDDASDHSSDESVPHINLTVDAFFNPAQNKEFEKGIQNEYMSDLFGSNISLIGFQNDHCYTPLTSPRQSSDNEIQRIKDEIESYSSTAQKQQIPNSKKITVLESKVITKGKGVQYFNTNMDVLKRPSNTINQVSHVIKKADAGLTYPKPTDLMIESFTKKPCHDSTSKSQEENNSDDNLDNKSLLKRDVKKILSRKIEQKNNGSLNMLDHDNQIPETVRRVSKTYNRVVDDKSKPLLIKPDQTKRTEQIKQTVLVSPKPEAVQKTVPPKAVVKKDKKNPAHMTALLNDTANLFSSPDVIRRISTETKTKSTEPANTPGIVYKSPDKNIGDSFNVTKTTKTYTRIISDESRIKDTVNIIPDQLFSDSILNPVSVQTTIPENTITNTALMSPVTMASSTLTGPLSPSLDLLSGLPYEEGLTEDLLRHVAQLVESSENLQEVIDKQVLGKVGDITPKDNTKPVVNKPIVPPPTPILAENEKTFIGTSALKKEPIQIIRANGRVITLPPIEAPATRSSKRKSLMNSQEQLATKPVVPEVKPAVSEPKASSSKQKVPENGATKNNLLAQFTKQDDDAESDESWNSEDDPDRLWCICKQPHNNRFMICCDTCEDWFHGKCVNVTKAMGQEMEEKGIEWRCPNCLKKKEPTGTPLKTPPPRRSTDDRSNKSTEIGDSNNGCIVCKKLARPSSIYCSDACILKHAQESLIIASPPTSNIKSSKDGQIKPKLETRVIVYERKSGKFLAGPSAPTTTNLKTWLQEHPTYEVVRPNTTSADKNQMKSKAKPTQASARGQLVLSVGHDKHLSLSQSNLKSPTQTTKPVVKQAIQITPQNMKSASTSKPLPLKLPLKSPPTPKPPTPQPKPTLKSPTTPTHQRRDDQPPRRSSAIEPIRDNVRKALQQQISLRMAESKDVKITAEEIKTFSVDTEFELHDLFKDVGAKYKAKYRSLMFNLKDRKNLTLWQKICDRSITPKQLVRLSPEELASQELAQWRDKEAKHQLELIKKSELDLLACNKTYVLKTHKGEEVMESRTTGTAELDPNLSVEDLMSELNKSIDDGETSVDKDSRPSSPVAQRLTSPTTTSRDTHHSSSSHHKHTRHRSRSHNRSRSHKSSRSNTKSIHSSGKDDKTKHSTSRDRKNTSRSHHRRSSRDKDKLDKREKKDDGKRTSSSRSRSERERKRSTSNDKRPSSSLKDDNLNLSSTKGSKIDLKPIKEETKFDPSSLKIDEIKSPIDFDEKSYTKSIDASYKIDHEIKSPYSDFPDTPDISVSQRLLSGAESDQEPSSTVDTLNSAVWTGCVNMVDVAKFNITAHEVSGQSDDVIYELDTDLDIVGRISADTVWDYIARMKKQGSKDMLILKLTANSPEDKVQYMALYNYLDTRSRLGVVKVNNNGGIKDFYILPLSSPSAIHKVLLPINGPGFGESKTNMLVGILVKQRRKRQAQISSHNPIPSKIAKIVDRIKTPPTEASYTPPRSPKRKTTSFPTSTLSGIPLPSFSLPSGVVEKIAASLACADDDDEPYSPGGSSSRSLGDSRSPARYEITPSTAVTTDLQKKMEELTRKIEEEKKHIENMAVNRPETLDEPYSPSRPMSPPIKEPSLPILSNIFIPSNLQEILASVQKNTAAATAATAEYIPTNISVPSLSPYSKDVSMSDVDMRMMNLPPYPSTFPIPDTSTKIASKLSTLSEAELLSMVPDDEILRSPSLFPPLPPVGHTDVSVPPPPYKTNRVDYKQPPPPGLSDNL